MYILIGTNVNMDNWRLNHLKSLYTQDSSDDFVLYALAHEYRKIGDLEQSRDLYQQLQQRSPDYVGLYYHLAAVFVELEEADQALKTYEEGIKIAQKLGDHHALGELKNAKTNFELEL